MLKIFTVIMFFLLAYGCIFNMLRSDLDNEPVNISTLNLYNQKTLPRYNKKSWSGDWIFRRHRLTLIDNAFHKIKPDIICFQEMMSKKGNPIDSDENILYAGALNNFSFNSTKIKYYEDTNEFEYLSTAISFPLKFDTKGNNNWKLNKNTFLTANTVLFNGRLIPVFNVKMSNKFDASSFSFIKKAVKSYISINHLCAKRILIVGSFNDSVYTPFFDSFLTSLNLIDVAEDVCSNASNCFTDTLTNEIYFAIAKDQTGKRLERILVNKNSAILNSKKVFNKSTPANKYIKLFGISYLWPSYKFGWYASVILPTCKQDELGKL